MNRMLSMMLVILTAAGVAAANEVWLAVDVSRSVSSTQWRTITNRVAADVASLPEGTSLRVVTFGAAVDGAPVFSGVLDLEARERVIGQLERLRPTADWTFFQPAVADAEGWVRDVGAGDAIGVIYSDGKSSLPRGGLRDLAVGSVLAGGDVIDVGLPLFLWRPATRTYALVASPGAGLASVEVATLEEAARWRSPRELFTERLQRLLEEQRADVEAMASWTLAGEVISELGPARLGAVVLLPVLGLSAIGLQRRQKMVAICGPTPIEMEPPELPADPRTQMHLELVAPDDDGDAVVVAVPDEEVVTLSPSPDFDDVTVRWVTGLPVPIDVKADPNGLGGACLRHRGDRVFEVRSMAGLIRPFRPGTDITLLVGDSVLLDDWAVTLKSPQMVTDNDFLMTV